MPLYSYKCDCGNKFDKFMALKCCDDPVVCPKCYTIAVKDFTPGHGGIQTDGDVSWIPDARRHIQPDGEKPIETRGELKQYCKDHGIVART